MPFPSLTLRPGSDHLFIFLSSLFYTSSDDLACVPTTIYDLLNSPYWKEGKVVSDITNSFIDTIGSTHFAV
jgi:hypothetical protein